MLSNRFAPKYPAVRSVLYSYALQLKGSVAPNFTSKPEWRQVLYTRLDSAGIKVDRKEYDAAAPLVDQWISTQVARLAFGDSTAFRRDIPEDPQLTKAIDLLKRGSTQKELFSLAQATRPASH